MGTTAEKLTYLNETKGKIKDSINLTGANIGSNDTFRSYAVKLRDGLVNVLNNGTATLYNNFPKVSGTGSNISLSNTLEAPMFMNKFDGDTYQQTYTGKNLLPINQIQSQTINGITITNLSDGTIKINGTTSSTTRIDVSYTKSLIANTSYKFINSYTRNNSNANVNIQDVNNSVIGSITLNNTNSTFTPNSDVEITKMRLYIDSSQTFDNYILKVMLIKSSETETYEPYVGGTASPNPDYPQDIQSVEGIQNVNVSGKNLLNASQESYTFEANTNTTLDNIGTIYLEANKKYYITYNIDNATTSNIRNTPFVRLGSASRIYQSATSNYNLTTGRKTWEYTPSESGNYHIGYWCATPDIDLTISKFMVSISSDTTYVPYKAPQTYEVNLGTIKLYNGDYITGTPDNWSIVYDKGEVVFDGTESGWETEGKITNYYRYQRLIPNGTQNDNNLCNYFKYLFNYNQDVQHFYISSSGRLYIFSTETSLNDFKTWLSTHNTKIVYKLATPTTEAITDTNLISQLNALYNAKSYDGQTNITVSGNLPMILEVSALKDEI